MTQKKIAVLSNVNVEYVRRILAKTMNVVPSIGYGDVWGQLMNPNSSLNAANANVIVFIIDIEALVDGCFELSAATKVIREWYLAFDAIIQIGKDYFISDVSFRSDVLVENDSIYENSILKLWTEALQKRVTEKNNVHELNLNNVINRIGKDSAFSRKLWYMGKIPYSNEGCKAIAAMIGRTVNLLDKTTKKVLVLDLDNTLWGGVLGEVGVDGIDLSDDHIGAVYKKVQQQIKSIRQTGILLAIVSKNNESDVQEVWDRHPYMILKRGDFADIRINWMDKADNIQKIAKNLNLGIDSFVFIDDMMAERENIRLRLPGVIVPEFPDKIEDYPLFMADVFESFFKTLSLSAEDLVKSRQYAENALREEASEGVSYEEFLRSLNLKADRVELNEANLNRIAQLHGKTNQFNLTTIRYGRQDIERLLHNGFRIYAYKVSDKFGDYGLVAVVIVDCNKMEINSFLMSCRIMGKLVENYILEEVENDLKREGHKFLFARYVKTAKNAPVEKLFDGLGYRVIDKTDVETKYQINLENKPQRIFFVNDYAGNLGGK